MFLPLKTYLLSSGNQLVDTRIYTYGIFKAFKSAAVVIWVKSQACRRPQSVIVPVFLSVPDIITC